MESTIPGRTKCEYVEASSPKILTDEINTFLNKHIVLDIKYIQNYQMYGAYILYLTDIISTQKIEKAEYEMGEPETYGLK